MSYLFEKTGLIRDRSRGYKEMSYYVPKHNKTFMRSCKTAHETITGLLPKERRQTITPQEMKQSVLLYVSLNEEKRVEMITKLVLPYNNPVEKLGTHTLKELFEFCKIHSFLLPFLRVVKF